MIALHNATPEPIDHILLKKSTLAYSNVDKEAVPVITKQITNTTDTGHIHGTGYVNWDAVASYIQHLLQLS